MSHAPWLYTLDLVVWDTEWLVQYGWCQLGMAKQRPEARLQVSQTLQYRLNQLHELLVSDQHRINGRAHRLMLLLQGLVRKLEVNASLEFDLRMHKCIRHTDMCIDMCTDVCIYSRVTVD